jgi:NAD(P)-dependent dehydrogenase (short-subunit alcohol dehydrogenase family)
VLVNNAGIAVRKDSEDLQVDEMDRLWNVNVRSALLLTAAVLPAMLERQSGSIVSISSISGLRGAPRRALYAATKAALDGMTRALAMEYGPRGIRANAVAPGVVETEMWRENLARPGVTAAVLDVIPTRRVSTPEEVADTVVFLASDASRAITGEVISADGGIHATVNLWPTV